MLGVDNITFWSAKPGNFINRNTGENILKNINISEMDKFPSYTGTQEEWNATLASEVLGVFRDAKIPPGSLIEVLCPDIVGDILACSSNFDDNTLNFDEFKAEVKLVGVNEPRIDVFMNKKFAGAVNILDL